VRYPDDEDEDQDQQDSTFLDVEDNRGRADIVSKITEDYQMEMLDKSLT
jgi:hypothetical protein